MKDLDGTIDGPNTITSDVAMHGVFTGDVTVINGATLTLRGMINADLHVERGGTAIIRGMVTGGVYNHGGRVTIYGTVDTVTTDRSGITLVDAHALVRRP